jgi:membrane peptidoglycan carboxypeptidase
MGVSDKGETFYYAESADGTQGAMVVLDPSTGQYASFVGEVTNPQEGYVSIADFKTGNTLTFEITAADKEGDVVIDMGEQGKAVLATCTIDEVMQCFKQIDTYGKAVA